MDEMLGGAPIVRPDFYHRPVAAPGAHEEFYESVRQAIKECGRDNLIKAVRAGIRAQAEYLQALSEEDRRNCGRNWVFDTTPTSKEFSQLYWVAYAKRTLRLSKWHILFDTKKGVRRRWHRMARDKWGARQVVGTSHELVLTHYEWYPYEGSRYPERYEPKYIIVFVTSEGDLMFYHENNYEFPRELDLNTVKDATLVSLWRVITSSWG